MCINLFSSALYDQWQTIKYADAFASNYTLINLPKQETIHMHEQAVPFGGMRVDLFLY